ncbi:DUF427 domain-containing protein [Algoriphagus sediminis]|uniref:DUF427 domain-containing protein n=1 Tax=Algoriphagus sediminis TaxID=3057113 RepID=A0ABT7YE12_9BACT|nr:DUF427 domain-containing protein [Algoriphagus sediminis]MDN3204434.1 DUF427 domain-containing protein [Algoriphagus sediminis]
MHPKRIKPKPGQESVWDYPRPPRLEKSNKHIRIVFAGEVILDTNLSFRILETSHPPTYYIPHSAFKEGVLIPVAGASYCEWKGEANYYDIRIVSKISERAAWGYKNPNSRYPELKNTVSIYAHKVDACFINDEKVQAQNGDFYGGWITSDIVGPFKGGEGTWGW